MFQRTVFEGEEEWRLLAIESLVGVAFFCAHWAMEFVIFVEKQYDSW